MENTADFQFHGTVLHRYTGPGGDVVIPHGVSAIEESAFACCYTLTSVVIPDSVKAIGQAAFCYCTEMTSIKIPASVTAIGHSAFKGCHALTSICLPFGVTSVDAEAFYNCYRLRRIDIPNSVTSVGKNAFGGCISLQELSLPDNIIAHGSVLFDGNCGLFDSDGFLILKDTLLEYAGLGGDVVIPHGVRAIRNDAFAYAFNMTSVVIPDSVAFIGSHAFFACEDLISAAIPPSVVFLGKEAFSCCTNLCLSIPESLSIPDSDLCRLFNPMHPPEVLRFPGKSLQALAPYEKAAAVGYAELVDEGHSFGEALEEEYRSYMLCHREKLYPLTVAHPGLLHYLFARKIVPPEDVQTLLELFQRKNRPDLTAEILEYVHAAFTPGEREAMLNLTLL